MNRKQQAGFFCLVTAVPNISVVNELSSGGTCFASLIPSHFCGYWVFSPPDWSNILWLLQTACLTCQSCSVAACHSLCLGCSHVSISVHFTSLSIASFLTSFASFGLSWSYLGLSHWFTAWKWHSCQSGILQCMKSLFPGRLETAFSSLWMLLQWSSPSIPLLSLGWCRSCILIVPAHKLLFRTYWLIICSICPCKSGQEWSFLIYMFSMKHKNRLGHHWGFQTLMAGRFLLECHSLHLRWWNRNWCLKGWIHSLRDLPGWVCCLSCSLLSLSSEFWETHLYFSTWGSCDSAVLGDAWNAGET